MFKRLLGIFLLVGILFSQFVPHSSAFAQSLCDQAQFVADVTVPDGSSFAPGAAFTKTWRLKNIGTCTWTTSYTLVWTGGDQMEGPASTPLTVQVAPNQTVDLSVNLTAPATTGHYKGLWKLANASGVQFGIGNAASTAFWADINVGQSTVVQNVVAQTSFVGFDFIENASISQWKSGAGALPFPGASGDSRGFATIVDQPHLEDGTFDTSKAFLLAPQNKFDGYIQMTSPNILISPGDKLETLVSCEFGASGCYVTFRIDYLNESGGQLKLWSWKEAYDGRFYRASIDLSPLAGKGVRFVFMTLATGTASSDRALWVAPRIIRSTGGTTAVPPTLTPGPGPTQTPSPGGVVSNPYIRQLYMKDTFNGWALGDSYLLRTTNGGTTWTNVTPPNASFVNGSGGFFLSSSTGWLLTGESKLYRTTNAGTTWTTYNVPFSNGHIQFTDTYHGFVLYGLPSGMNKQAVALYKTNNGGATWTKNYDNSPNLPTPGTSLPFGGHKNGMTFRDSLAGWVGGDIPMDGFVYLYRTTDAGKNWAQQNLTLPSGYESAFVTIKAPTFFGTSTAVLPVWLGRTEGIDLATYLSTNGGISWTRTAGFAKGASFVDYVTSKIGFTWDHSGVFQMTSNTGGTWTHISPNINFGDDFRGMDFVSSTTGWVIQRHPDNSTSLYKTTDGAATWTLLSTNKPGGTPSDTPTPTSCDKVTFVADVTIPDGTTFAPSAPFTKTWRLKNSGTCTWTTSYKLVFQSGEQMGGPASLNLPTSVAPGATVDLSVNLTAPATAGHYRGYWLLSNANGALFGMGTNSNSPFWVDINVSGSTTSNTAYDFTANICAAQWKSGAGALPCPGTDGSSSGFVLKLDSPVMEDGSVGAPGFLTIPQNKFDGYIQGFYPEFTVQSGDRFQAKVGCQQGQNCYVTYRLNYMTTSGWIGTFWQWRESNDGKYYTADVDLTPLAGKKVRFILTILATGYATGDRAVWSAPRIYRLGAGTSPTAGPTSQTSNWPFFTSPQYGFNLQYPPGSTVFNSVPESAIINMPIVAGTTLVEKYLSINMVQNASTCFDPTTGSSPLPENVVINGTTFLKDVGLDGGMSQTRKVTQYTTTRNNLCYSFLFVLHSVHASDPPLPDYNEAAESAVIQQIMQSFGWLASAEPSITPHPPSPTVTPMVSSLNAKVTAGLLSCRYGPGAEYLYLYALNQGANIKLIGRTDANNWVWVDGANKCWVNASFLQITGDPKTLPIVYPGTAKLPVSPYYPAPAWASAVRNGNSVTVEMAPVPVSPGDYEDAEMHQYILEVWRCEAGQIIFETLGSNTPSITVPKDEAGCSIPSHGRVFVQEKHGFAGPVEPPWPQPTQSQTSTATTGSAAFTQSLVDLLNARNFDAVKTKMGQTFATGFWESQGTSSTPDQAIEAFRNLYVGPTPLVSDPNKDLNSLLGGLNPYGIMGLDPANAYGLFVSGLGPEGKSEAIFYVVKKTDGSYYFYGMLFAPTKFIHDAPTATSAPVTLTGPYAVVRLLPEGVLNIYSAAGSGNQIVGSFSGEATNVMRTGPTASAEGAEWVQVQNPTGGTGWVNSSYLTEHMAHDAFCSDSRILPLIDKFTQSLNSADGNLLSTLVSPKHGVDFHLWKYGPAINFTQTTVKNIYTDATSYNWGGGPSGIPDVGTFSIEIKPNYLDALNAPNREIYCDSLTKVYPLFDPWPHHTIRYYNIYKPATPNIFFDFRSLLIGVEFVNNQPYLYSVITIVWEP